MQSYNGNQSGGRTGIIYNPYFRIAAITIMGILTIINVICLCIWIGKLSNAEVSPEASELSLTETNKGRARKGELIFNEDFNSFNLDIWEHEITMSGGGNGEFQLYHNNRSNSYVKFGKLYIKPTLTEDQYGEAALTNNRIQLGGGAPADQCTNPLFDGCVRKGSPTNPINPVMSARIRTVNSFSFKYGKMEVKAKMPAGDWIWPAIWLMPAQNQYGGWPASGEIDLVESRGNLDLREPCRTPGCKGDLNVGAERVGSTLHFGPFWPENGFEKAHFNKFSPQSKGFNQDFHLYSLEWTPEHIRFSVDNEEIGQVKPDDGGFWRLGGFPDNFENPWTFAENNFMAPFDRRFYIILNVAVGGTGGYFPDTMSGSRKPWKNNSPQAMADFWDARYEWLPTWKGEDAAMQVDYVRVWAL